MTALLEVRDLSGGYNGAAILSRVSLSVGAGEIVALVGGNGAGKTTLIRTIAGMLGPTSGSIRFGGNNITGASPNEVCEAGLAQVPEGRQLFPDMTVEDNLRLGAMLRRARDQSARNLERVFALFPRLAERRRQLAGTLSGGEQQMTAIGRAIMAEPRMIMLDEPSLGLAPIMVDAMFDAVRDLNEQGIGILLVEQNVAQSLALATRGYVLENGEVVVEGHVGALTRDERVRQAYLGL